MRRVYDQDALHDRTQGQRALRKLFEENPKEFIAQLARLERSHQAGIAKGLASPPQLGPISPVPASCVPEPVEELCRRLLSEALAATKQ